MKEKIAVLAGTPVDTRMGMDCLRRAGLDGAAFPVGQNPVEQTAFQVSDTAEKTALVRGILERAARQGCTRAMIYCNSLSGAVDFPPLARATGLRIVTPLDVYRDLAARFRALGVLSANAQGLAGIERTLVRADSRIRIYGACCLGAVLAVEAEEAPSALVERLGLGALADWMAACGAEALVLGCTHFPYFRAALAAKTALPLLDPADGMLELLAAD
ncbi:MAG: aspartate/glutamate racemase family protein [Oscillibacter sp.]|jgi:glutamate racemase|nr:aspartate/glutamate racemase family protein [Oscillibacter sp.]